MAYSFEQVFAADPSNPANIASNAAVLIYAPGDATKTPIAITDPSGSPLYNPIPVNANGFGSAFIADIDRVAWDGGGFSGFFTSYDGMKEEAKAAREAAQEIASQAASGAFNGLPGSKGDKGDKGEPGLPGVNAVTNDEATEALIKTPGSKTAAALANRYVEKNNGPVTPLTSIAAFGESTTASTGVDWPSILATMLGVTVTNQGISGQGAADVILRTGALRPKVTIAGNEIPASGTVAITSIDPATGWRVNGTGTFAFAGTIAGVAGSLAHDLVANTWSFTRTTAGTAVTVEPGVEFIHTVTYPTHRLLLGTGRNNVTDNSLGMAGDLVGLAPQSLTPQIKKYKIWGVINGTNEPTGHANYTAIKNYNTRLATEHGARFYDLRRDFIDQGLALAGITPTSADTTNITADAPPPSLMADIIHPNYSGYSVIAYLLAQQLVKDGWAGAVTLPAVLSAPASITLGTATDTTQALSWPAVTGATAYKVEYRTSPAGSWITSAGVSGTSHTVTGLTAGTAYDYRVSTVNLGGTGSPSTTATGSTSTPPVMITSDSFNRADTAAGVLGTTDAAYGGSPLVWTSDAQIQILSNQVGATTLSSTRHARVDTGASDHRVEIKLVTLGNGQGPVVRRTDSSNYYSISVDNATGVGSLTKRVGNVGSTIGNAGTFAAGDVVGLSIVGNKLTTYKNGVQTYTVTDSSLASGTWAGFQSAFNMPAFRVDDFKVWNK